MRERFVPIGRILWIASISGALASSAAGDAAYQKPPKGVLDVLDAPATPSVLLSPARDRMLLIETERHPSIADLAQPMLRLAGLRINPATNGPHNPTRVTGLTLVNVADGAAMRITLPPNPHVGLNFSPRGAAGRGFRFPPRPSSWSADGKYVALTQTSAAGIELWILETATARARRVPGLTLNAAYGEAVQWMPDQKSLLVQTIPAGRGKAPTPPAVPKGPTIQENYGKKAPVWTFEDLLKNAHDEDLFDFFATAQLAIVDPATGKSSPLGKPGIFQTADPSPDGNYVLVARVHRPYSYLIPHNNFPKELEVWDRRGASVHRIASLTLQEQVPNNGVPVGPRDCTWRPTEPATLTWAEALDEGNPRARVPHRDRVLMTKAPFQSPPQEVAKTEYRYTDLTFVEKGGVALLEEYDRYKRWRRTWVIDADRPAEAPRKLWDRADQDHYGDPGSPATRILANGKRAIALNGDSIFLTGQGGSDAGDRPFLDRLDLRTRQSQRLFRAAEKTYETVLGLLSDDGARFLTRFESPADAPNVFARSSDGRERRALTKVTDPAPQIRKIRQQLVTYKRPDGVQLSFTLYLPPDRRDGERLPTVIWAYPREYTDAAYAGQVTGSPHRFLTIEGMSHLFFLLQGYAVLDDATMPVVGDSETVNNTYVEQIVASAKAAIDKAAEMGVTDPARVGVGGHSYGAFMTANLLTHSSLFRAGIARSGAYNRTLTPFGFQQELRTIWEAPDVYLKMSPFMHVNKINTPILLIHGEADNNSGTFPIQSERYYHALKGNGKTARYVTLPHESHGYAARESIEHVLFEMISWFDKHVKNPGRAGAPTGAGSQR